MGASPTASLLPPGFKPLHSPGTSHKRRGVILRMNVKPQVHGIAVKRPSLSSNKVSRVMSPCHRQEMACPPILQGSQSSDVQISRECPTVQARPHRRSERKETGCQEARAATGVLGKAGRRRPSVRVPGAPRQTPNSHHLHILGAYFGKPLPSPMKMAVPVPPADTARSFEAART